MQKFIDEKWTNVDDVAKIVKPEAQAWFCVRQLLLNPQIMENYAFNEARCKQLSKVSCDPTFFRTPTYHDRLAFGPDARDFAGPTATSHRTQDVPQPPDA